MVAVLAHWASSWAWSADGKRILYSPRAEGGTWTVDLDTKEKQKLWDFTITDATVSPDGSKLLCYVPEPLSENVIVSIPSGHRTIVFGADSALDGAWSPDSKKLAVLERHEPGAPLSLWVMAADGSGPTQIGQVDARGPSGRLGWISPRQLVVAYPDAIVILEEDGKLTSVIALPR